jgi:hypothetical protein
VQTPDGEHTIIAGTSVVVTPTGYRPLGADHLEILST